MRIVLILAACMLLSACDTQTVNNSIRASLRASCEASANCKVNGPGEN